MIAHMLPAIPEAARQPILIRLGRDSRSRLRVYGREGDREADSWAGVPPTYELRDPTIEPWYREVARWLDNGFDAIVGAGAAALVRAAGAATGSRPGPRR